GDADHRDEIVAAGVSDLGERVVFLKDRDRWTRRAALRVAAIARLDAAVAALHTEPRAFEELGDAQRGLALLVCELGLRVDGAREGEQRLTPLVDRFDRALAEGLGIAQPSPGFISLDVPRSVRGSRDRARGQPPRTGA